MNPTLTIAIPTYNRPEFLYKALVRALAEISNPLEVAILVLDDSSGTLNQPVIEMARRAFPDHHITYQINPENLGIDRNIVNCIQQSSSEYVWLLGEDDLITRGSVQAVLEVIHLHRPRFVFANYAYCNGEHSMMAAAPVIPKGSATAQVALVELEAFLSEYAWALGFIGGCIVNRRAWLATEYSKYDGSYYSHVGGILDSAQGSQIAVVHQLCVLNRAEDINTFTWSASTFPVYFSFYEVLKASRLPETVKVRACKAAERLFAIYRLPWLAAKRADGVYNLDIFKNFYAKSDRSVLWKSGAAILAMFPRLPLRWLRRWHLSGRFSQSTSSFI